MGSLYYVIQKSMEAFQYSPVKKFAIERDNTTIASDESFDREFAKCGFADDVIEIPSEIEFDLRHQMTLHLYPDIVGLLGDENGDTGTIRSNCSDATIATSKTAPSTPIDYLTPRPKPPIPKPSTVETEQTPTVPMTDPTDKADAPKTSPTPTTTSSEEDTPNNRSEESSED